MAALGLAYDRKTVSKAAILARVKRTGDGSYKSGWVLGLSGSFSKSQPGRGLMFCLLTTEYAKRMLKIMMLTHSSTVFF